MAGLSEDPEFKTAEDGVFELERQWEVPLRMKPLRLQSATVVKVPVKEPGTYAIVERKKMAARFIRSEFTRQS
jgi:hypothetical protein